MANATSPTEKETRYAQDSFMYQFLPKLKELFPLVPEKILRRIIKEGCHQMHEHIVDGEEVLLSSTCSVKVKLLIYERDYDIVRALKDRALRRKRMEQRRRIYAEVYPNFSPPDSYS